jgi:hypothetical protein
MLKGPLLTLFLFGCSSSSVEHPYAGSGDTKIHIQYDGSWSLRSKTVLLGIYEMVKKCDYKFLGDVRVNDEIDQTITIPSGKKVILRTIYLKKSSERTLDFLFIPKKDHDYNFKIYERDGFLGNSGFLITNDGRVGIEPLVEKCAHR